MIVPPTGSAMTTARLPHPDADARAPAKPVLRGVFHEVAAAGALAAWVLLVAAASPGAATAAAAVYGATLFALFATSALYHRPNWPPRARTVMRRLDHSAIYLLIAGTYTPFCLLVGGTSGRAMLAVAWGGAALGVLQSLLWIRAPKAVSAAIYVLLGWVVLPVVPAMLRALGPGALALLAAGGLAYTLGAVVYATRRPDPIPRVLGYHEIFHALVVVAAALQLAVVAQALRAIR
jgi:hemolysin III